jgi:hypothetical protein
VSQLPIQNCETQAIRKPTSNPRRPNSVTPSEQVTGKHYIAKPALAPDVSDILETSSTSSATTRRPTSTIPAKAGQNRPDSHLTGRHRTTIAQRCASMTNLVSDTG